ncbi:ArsR/SmtB family transcription factor [Herbiconiux daphne]|uniref:Metalloregulator ArsR/SmtB family transcription factor n=1 Tax=Herbiconiux daphne TaxID=2970914 RepID=A0ABT2GZW1_9MICO|nr:metalloregulator ArsR/SmtB family transcription factor [Herbiconiux daphne]MCS5733426.1 metalloregulator ArsR/SmtB family transcription factor [Herbiconiux daphne]
MITEVVSAIADPSRRAILDSLRRGELAVGDIVAASGVAQPAASKHLRVLRELRVVRVRKDAQRRLYSIDPVPMSELDRWLEPYRVLWNGSLDALGRHLDAVGDADTSADE